MRDGFPSLWNQVIVVCKSRASSMKRDVPHICPAIAAQVLLSDTDNVVKSDGLVSGS
jgi:hypothetical protein